MKRDMDLVRELLLALEDRASTSHVDPRALPIEGRTDVEIQYHLNLIYQAGLIDAEATRSSTSERIISVIPFGLTWQGHEFLDTVRDAGIWSKAKSATASAGTASIKLIWGAAQALLTSEVEKRTGLTLHL